MGICRNSQRCWCELKLGGFKLADVITHSTNHCQKSHTYGIMCINMQPDQDYIHSTTFNYHMYLNLGTLLSHPFICINLYPSSRSPSCGPYTREFRGHYHSYSPHNTEPNREYPNWYSVLLPVPTSLVERIESGAFIMMGDLILTRIR